MAKALKLLVLLCLAAGGAFVPRPALPGAALGLLAPMRAEAFEMPNLQQFFSTVFRVVTTGTNEAFDPTTEEGAQALGLASPLPKEGFGEISADVPGFKNLISGERLLQNQQSFCLKDLKIT